MKRSSRIPAQVVGGRYLLDTHALLFMDQAPHRLSDASKALIEDTRNRLFVSIASLWELQIKSMIGKLTLPLRVDRMMLRQQRENDVDLLPIEAAHVVEHAALPFHHRDPFDRMLIAQARVEGLTLLSRDAVMQNYDVAVQW